MKRPFLTLVLCIPLLLIGCIEFISPNVSEIVIPLQNPPDSLFTNRDVISFQWEASDLAEAYHFQLFVEEGATQYLMLDTLMESHRLRMKLPEGCYTWQVRAQNASSVSTFEARELFIDNSPPMLPQAIYPLPGDTIFHAYMPEDLRWQSGDVIASNASMSVRDSVYVYQWRNGWPVLIRALTFAVGAEKVIHLPEAVGEMKTGAYGWEVKSFDQVGYENCSRLFKFFLQ